MSTEAILEFLQKEVGLGKTQAYAYLKWAREEISQTLQELNSNAIGEAVGQLEHMLMMAAKQKNMKLWLDLRKELNRLGGLYVDKVDFTSGGKDISQITFEIVNKREGNNE
jgi:hypothetical protein